VEVTLLTREVNVRIREVLIASLLVVGAILVVIQTPGFNSAPEGAEASLSEACTPPPAGMIAWWRGEGTALDAIGSHDGELAGNGSYIAGRVGQAFNLNGSTKDKDSVVVPDDDDWAFGTADFSIDAWIFIGPQPSGDMTIAVQTSASGSDDWWRFGITSGGRLTFTAAVNNGPPLISVSSIVDSFETLTWHHVAVTRKGTTGWAFYHDGVLLPPDVPPNVGVVVLDGPVPDLDGWLHIGGGTDFFPFRGRLDEIEIFSRALEGNEIGRVYAAGAAGKCVPGADTAEDQRPPAVGAALQGLFNAPTATAAPAVAVITLVTISPPNTGEAGLRSQ
jgi:hypothetical protein